MNVPQTPHKALQLVAALLAAWKTWAQLCIRIPNPWPYTQTLQDTSLPIYTTGKAWQEVIIFLSVKINGYIFVKPWLQKCGVVNRSDI